MAGTGRPNKQWAKKYPELGTGPVANRPCVSPEYFELERERIFRRAWLNVGRINEIPKPGDYLVKDLTICRTSLLIVHGQDGKVRAFHNMCSHRGNQIVWDETGNCRYLTCRFHGWVYDTSGKLVAITDKDNFFDVKKDEYGLTPIATDVWQGFIFVNLDPNPEEGLREYLGEVVDHLEGYPFDQLTTCFRHRADDHVNWKVLLDAQQEGYHIPFLHRRTIIRSWQGDASDYLSRSSDVRLFKRHRVTAGEGGGNAGPAPSPVEALARRYGTTTAEALAGTGEKKERNSSLIGSLDFWVLFPNFVLGLMEGTYFSYNLWPLAVDHTIWDIRNYYLPALSAGQRFSQEFAMCTLRDTLLEDASTHERIQQMLASGAKTHFLFQDEEVCLRHGHKVVADYVGF